ncbi:MAG: putative type secretion system integral rane subunit, partial [Thermoleophilia bacterium]|nr:putative type secretion system integral rane subunit [Thermoleophilia bacterium]
RPRAISSARNAYEMLTQISPRPVSYRVMNFTRTRLTCALSIALALFCANAANAVAASPSLSASGDVVTITDIDTSHFPTVRVAFGADEHGHGDPNLRFFENGQRLSGVSLYRGKLGRFENRAHTDLILVLDTSLSMRGARITKAKEAARRLLAQANADDRIGLVTFGGDADLVAAPTTDRVKLSAAIAQVSLRNRTTLFDGVQLAARSFATDSGARRAIVLLSDGADTGGKATLDDAAGAALKAAAPVFSVSITNGDARHPRALEQLGNGTGGEVRTIADNGDLGQLFSELGRRILQPYWVEYRSPSPDRSSVDFGIAVGSDTIDASRTFRATLPTRSDGSRRSVYVAPKSVEPAAPVVRVPDGSTGLLLVSLPFGLTIFFLTWMFLRKRSTPDVLARVALYTERATIDTIKGGGNDGPLLRRLAAPFLKISDSFLGKSAFFARITFRAEQAAIAIKPSELFIAMVAMGLVGALFGVAFGFGIVGAVVGLVVLGSLPNLWLKRKAKVRRKRFENQLADVLQSISSSLNAGHSFNQAINAMIKDSPAPTSDEFQRVMTEARLGMPIEDALQHMADRMGSPDFDFAVTTVNIQRTVGGSLADILQMVGDTVRNRQQFRKKVKALTSMGQMSAYVLLAMPVFIGLILGFMSPSYMKPLLFTSIGHMMLAAGAVSMTLGYVTCMKIVNVKV